MSDRNNFEMNLKDFRFVLHDPNLISVSIFDISSNEDEDNYSYNITNLFNSVLQENASYNPKPSYDYDIKKILSDLAAGKISKSPKKAVDNVSKSPSRPSHFVDINSKYFLSLLLNYLAIVPKDDIHNYLKYYFEKFSTDKKINATNFIKKHIVLAFKQYNRLIPFIRNKESEIRFWLDSLVESNYVINNPKNKENQLKIDGNNIKKSSTVFNLTPKEIDSAFNVLLQNYKIKRTEEKNFKSFFNNEFDKIQFNAKKVAIGYLINRMSISCTLTKTKIAAKLKDKIYCIVDGKSEAISEKQMKKYLYNNHPQIHKNNILLIDLFPEAEFS